MGQQITAIKLEADYVRSTINSSNDSEIRKSINDILEISSELLDSVRTISEGLYPSVLDQFTLEEALTELVDNWAQRDRHRVYRLSVGNIPKINRMDIKLAAYRVLQECLSNIVHHSKATEVDVALDIDSTGDTTLGNVGSDKVLLMNIGDNGIGFNTNEAVYGIGFLSMRERVLSVNGTFSLQSSPGEGCIVLACFPLSDDINSK
jgi:two-component system sensor histidine kinase UhpB